MGFFSKLKDAVVRKIHGEKNKVEDKLVDKIIPGAGTANYNLGSTGMSSAAPSYSEVPTQYDAEHEAKMEEMRKQKEMREMELEMQMQERLMGQGGLLDQVVGAQAGMMNAVSQSIEEQKKNTEENPTA